MENMELADKLPLEEQRGESICVREQAFKESGMSTVEIILILVVLIALVIIFKSQITTLVTNIFASIHSSASKIY